MAGAAIFLLVAAVVVGATACDGVHTYQLTISSASGGNVTVRGEGTFAHPAGSVAQLVATADGGYQFVSWTGDIADIANPSAASTVIAMNGNYAIIANFETGGETGPSNGGHDQS